jgi:glycosyltransferase involved in cell wall biosynthesis
VCFVSATLDSNFKGIHMLKEAMKIFSKQNPTIRVQLNLVGFSAREHDEDFGNVTLKKVGPVSSSRMVELIKKADYLLVPSQSDNLPNVISESQNLGTLVVATNVGGIPEMIVDGVTGFLSKNSALDFAITLKRALDSKNSSLIREQARDAAESRCSEENAGLHYKRVYEKLLVL